MKQLLSRNTLEYPHHIRPSILGRKGNKDVDMVTIGTDLLELDVIPETNFLRDLPNGERDLVCQKSPPVPNRKDDVIVGIVDIVESPTKAHAPILMRKPRVSPPSYKVLAAEPRGKLANLFRATQTDAKIRRENIKGEARANQTHFEVGKKVRQTIREIGGTMPERLPVSDGINKAKTRIKKLPAS